MELTRLVYSTQIVVFRSELSTSTNMKMYHWIQKGKLHNLVNKIKIALSFLSNDTQHQSSGERKCHSFQKYSGNPITISFLLPLQLLSTMALPISASGTSLSRNLINKKETLIVIVSLCELILFVFGKLFQMGRRERPSCYLPQHCPETTSQSHWYSLLFFYTTKLWLQLINLGI